MPVTFFGGFMALEDGSLQLVTFQLGEELYSVDIMKVKEIVKLQSIRTIPNSPDYIEGILNLRKEIIPIINLHKRFDIKESIKSEEDALLGGFIILQIKDSKIGIIIDRIARVVEIDVKDIQPPPQMITGIGAEYIQGVCNMKDGYLIILNTERLFNTKELQRIAELRN